MMQYKTLILVLFFYLLVLFQNSFLSHFSISGASLNLILISICLFSFFEESHKYSGLFLAIVAGFFLDVFSRSFLGISIFCLIIVYFFIKKTIHILRDIPRKYSIIYFIPIFIICVILYNLFFGTFSYLSNHFTPPFLGGYTLFLNIIYNLIFAVFGFYLFKKYSTLKA